MTSTVNPWHYIGDANFHRSTRGQELIDLTKKHLPKIEIPVKMGSTGYPCIKEPIQGRGWSLDEVGRMVILLDNILIFQRMVNGSLLLYGKTDLGSRAIFADQLCDSDYERFSKEILNHSHN